MKTKYLKKFRQEYCITEESSIITIEGGEVMTGSFVVERDKFKVEQKMYRVYKGLEKKSTHRGPDCIHSDPGLLYNLKEHGEGYYEVYNMEALIEAIESAKESFFNNLCDNDKKARKALYKRSLKITAKRKSERELVEMSMKQRRNREASVYIKDNKIKWL